MRNVDESYTIDPELTSLCEKWVDLPKMYMWEPQRFAVLFKNLTSLAKLFEEEAIVYKMVVYPCPLQSGDVILQIDLGELIIRKIDTFTEVLNHFRNFEIYPTSRTNFRIAAVFPKVLLIKPLQ